MACLLRWLRRLLFLLLLPSRDVVQHFLNVGGKWPVGFHLHVFREMRLCRVPALRVEVDQARVVVGSVEVWLQLYDVSKCLPGARLISGLLLSNTQIELHFRVLGIGCHRFA